jgi:spore maturation protein CgeB
MCADRPLSIIVVGQTIKGSRTPQRVRALQRLGHDVRMVPINRPNATYEDPPSLADRIRYRLRLPADPAGANAALLAKAKAGCDVVWVEAAPMIRAVTLRAVKRLNPRAPLVWYSEDDSMNPRHRSRWMERSFGLFDLWVTTKSFNARPEEVPSFGARRVLFVHNSFDPTVHCPVELTEDERREWGADVGFVGTYEAPRAASMLRLAQAGFTVRVWGNGWSALAGRHPNLMVENRAVYDGLYARVISASRVNLAFLRKGNRDLQTCRTMEIPACGGFMLHEYSDEAAALFPPGRAAAFFKDDDELCRQTAQWLADPTARLAVAQAGRRHALENAHSHDQRLHAILGYALGDAE